MDSIKTGAKEYVPQQTLNIADLNKVSVDLPLDDREGKDSDGKAFKYKVALLDDKEYRVPGVVLGQLKEILQEKPDLKTFKVKKSGTGLGTQYTVIPLE